MSESVNYQVYHRKMHPKPKLTSGPGRQAPQPQSRLAKTQSDAMKEMQEWARRTEEPGACVQVTRMAGQLSDNVTEERMLRAKLWELSKERYKFLLQNAYEKKLFADRMQRRTQAMLRARANSAAPYSRASPSAKPRPFTTSALTHHSHRPFLPSSSSSTLQRQLSAPKAVQVRPSNTPKTVQITSSNTDLLERSLSMPETTQLHPLSITSKTSRVHPVILSRSAKSRPFSTSKTIQSTSTKSSGRLVSSAMNVEGISRTELELRGQQTPSAHSDLEPNGRPVAPIKRSSGNSEQSSADTSDLSDSATSGEKSRMREVERSWVMSRGREKVTPAATTIFIPPPAASSDDGDGRMVLAPLQNTPATQATTPKYGRQPSHPLSATMPRNVHFSQMRGGKLTQSQRLLQRLNQSGALDHPSSAKHPNSSVPSSAGVLLNKGPPESGYFSKPTSAASSKRSAASTVLPAASFLSHKRGLLHRYGTRVESKTSDPRYTSLEHSLTPVPHPRVHPDVNSIVQNFDALHVRPRMRKEIHRSKTGVKALSYMNEHGFVF